MPNNIKVSDMEQAVELTKEDLVMIAQPNIDPENPETEIESYSSKKTTIKDLADKTVKNIQYTEELQTKSKTITGAINEAAEVGKISELYTYSHFNYNWGQWEQTDTTPEGQDIYRSGNSTYLKPSGNSLGTYTVEGYDDVTFYIKQDDGHTDAAYIVLGKPNVTIDLEDSDTYIYSGKNNSLTEYTAFHFENLYGNKKEFQILYRVDSAPAPTGTPTIDLNNGQWVDSGTEVDGHTVYKSTTHSDYGTSLCTINLSNLSGIRSISVYCKPSSESGYDITYLGELDSNNPSSDYEGSFSGIASEYEAVDYTIPDDGEDHFIKILYKKDSSSSSGDDCGYIYFVVNGVNEDRGYVYLVPGTAHETSKGEVFNNYTNNFATASYSHAEGNGNRASGYSSHAEGNETIANGSASHTEGVRTKAYSDEGAHAEGYETSASNSGAHAEGYKTSASYNGAHAEGYKTLASGTGAHAEGDGSSNSNQINIASSNGAHAEGMSTQALNWAAHAEGRDTIASGMYAHAEGEHTVSSQESSHAEGYYTTASGYKSHAEGGNTTASSEAAHAEGYYTVASGQAAHAEGYGDSTYHSVASGTGAHAEGQSTASNTFAHSEGERTTAYSRNSHAEGYCTVAAGDNAHAEGNNAQAVAEGAHAEGLYTIAPGTYQHVQGKYNSIDTGKAFIIGNGTTTSARSNALTVDWNGNMTLAGDITPGTSLTTTASTIAAAINELASGTYTKAQVDNLLLNLLPTGAVSGAVANFETEVGNVPLVSCKANIVATGGNGTPDNPNPINGYTEANITRCGVNLFNKTDNNIQNNARIATGTGGTYGAAGYSVSSYIKIDNSKPYVLTSGIQSYFAGYDENKTFIGGGSWNSGTSKTFLATVVYVRFDFQTADKDTVQLEQGSTATAHTTYNGQTYTIAFGQTVYGGVLDVTRGKLHVTHGKYTLNDVSALSRNSDHSFYFGATPAPKATGTAYYVGVLSDKFMPGETANQDVIFIHPNGFVRFNTANAYQSASDCFTAIGEITVVYPLATPFDIDLTPVQINALLGVNNVYNDTNGDTEVKYKEGIQHYIDKKIAETQALILS